MKIIALLEVDEAKLAAMGAGKEGKINRCADLDAVILEHEVVGAGSYEYAAFIWNKKLSRYEQAGRAVGTELLARNRCQEYLKNGWFSNNYDTDRVLFMRRITTEFHGRWEAIESEE